MDLEAVFSQILNMSLTGSVVILCVLAVRLLLKKAPKKFAYALWAVVLFRLLCPVSLPAPVSVLEVMQPEVTVQAGVATQVHYLPAPQPRPVPQAAPVSPAPVSPSPAAPSAAAIAGWIWAAGAAAMGLLSVFQHLRLKRTLRRATWLQSNVYLSGAIPTPFVLGIFRPKIYLPHSVTIAERPYILAHERFHIRRFDHIFKLLAWGALCLHWFNPLVWVAFLLAGKDMEMSCDEAVIRQMGAHIRADYATALLRLSTGKPILAGSPLAFGEGNTKGRILNMAKWKKPKIWVSVLSVLVCIAILTACALNPQTDAATTSPTQMQADQAQPLYFDAAQMNIPAEMHYVFLENCVQLYYGEAFNDTIGGITVYTRPRFDIEITDDGWNAPVWLEALGLPETADDARYSHEICDDQRGVNGYPQYGDLAAAYTTVPDDRPANVHFFYNLPARVYDFWFDQSKVSRDQIIAMMDSASVDPTAQPPVHAIDGFVLNGSLPCAIGVDPYGTLTFEDNGTTLGGVLTFPLPEDLSGDWMRQLPLWEWEDETLGCMADGNTIEFFSDVPPDQERTVLREHNFIFGREKLIDVWFDGLAANPSVQRAIFNAVSDTSDSPLVGPTPSAPYFNPPAGFTLSTQDSQSYTIKKGDQVVGGLSTYPLPDTYDPADDVYIWLERSGLSDFGNPDLYYNGGISDFRGAWNAQFSKADSDHRTIARQHYFFVDGDLVYDLWLDSEKLRDDEQTELRRGLSVPEQPQPPAPDSSPEGQALQICRDLMNEVSSHDWRIQGAITDKNGDALITTFTNDNGLRLRLVMQPAERAQKLLELEEPHSFLARFKFIKANAEYLDTVDTSDGICYQYRINAMYADQPGFEKMYYGDFYFDSDLKTFQRLELTVQPGKAGELRITETIEPETP